MNEKTLVRSLVRHLLASMPGAVVLKHSDMMTAGIPDISITWHGHTTWLEVKYCTDAASWRGLQRGRGRQTYTMSCLAAQGSALYVLYSHDGTSIIHPVTNDVEAFATGYSHSTVCRFIRTRHAPSAR